MDSIAPPPGMLKTAAQTAGVASCWIGCVIFPTCAMVQHENYPEFAHRWNESRLKHLVVLPEKLTISPRIKTTCTYVLTHAEKAFRIAGLVSAVGITILINPYYGVGLLSALVYEVIESKGYIPLKVNAFIYLGTVSLIGNIIYGGPLLKLYSLYELVCRVTPAIDLPLQYKVDRITRNCWSAIGRIFTSERLEHLIQKIKLTQPEAPYPDSLASARLINLEEYEAPFVDNHEHFQKLTYQEILGILEDTSPYQINPAHCSVDFTPQKMPKNANFDGLLTHFDAIDWQNNYLLIRNKLLRDDHFLNLIKGEFPETSIKELTGYTEDALPPNDYPHFEMYMAQLAQKSKLTKEQFVVQWVRQQMSIYVKVMKGEKQATGDPKEVLTAIKHTKKILAYLDTCQDPVTKADFLLKLAIEGGDYCSTALERTSSEILSSLLYDHPSNDQAGKIRYNLQQLRAHKVEEMYYYVAGIYLKVLRTDVHFFTWGSPLFKLGLLPWEKTERQLLSPLEIFLLNSYMNLSRYSVHPKYDKAEI